jgi:hypothetical protein
MNFNDNYRIDLEVSFYENLQAILMDGVLNVSSTEIKSLYEFWNSNFNSSSIINKFFPGTFVSPLQNLRDNVIFKGIDLPIWFGDYSKKKIVILGIDPLRNKDNFNQIIDADYRKDVIIGTPYALHEGFSRSGPCKGYWTFLKGLVDSNNFVYCTDIFKTYYFDPVKNIRSYNDASYTGKHNTSVHINILMKELAVIQPDLIIVYGKIAHSFLTGNKSPKISQHLNQTKRNIIINQNSTDVITVLHLSKTTRGKNFIDFFNQNNVNTLDFNAENRVHCAELYLEMLKNQRII